MGIISDIGLVMRMRISSIGKQVAVEVFGDKGWEYFWEERFLPRWLPLILGTGLGVLLAFLITDEATHFIVPVALAVPLAIIFNRYPFIGIILWIVVFPFFVQGVSVADRYVYWILHRAMIPGALGIVVLSNWLGVKKREWIQFGFAEAAMVLFVILGLANIFVFSNNPIARVYQFYDRTFVPFCAYWLIRLVAPRGKDWKFFLIAAFVALVTQAVIGLMAWFTPHLLPSQWLNLAGARTVGTLRNVAVYTSTVMFFSLLLYQHAINCESRGVRFVLLLVVGLGLFCVTFSFSRGSWVGEVVTLIGLLLLYPKTTARLVIVLAIGVFILGGSVLADEVAFAYERLTGEAATRSAEDRVVGNMASLRMIEAKPLFGWGYQNYDLYDRQFQSRVGDVAIRHDITSHNTYLTLMVEMGLIGFLLYMYPALHWLVLSVKTWKRFPDGGFWSRRLLLMLWLTMVHMFVVSNAMDMIRFHAFGTTIWWMALALIANMIYSHLQDAHAE